MRVRRYSAPMDPPGTVSVAQIITYLVGLLQVAGGLILNGLNNSIKQTQRELVAERERINQTREEMLKREEFREDIKAILSQIEVNAQHTTAAREALLSEVSLLRQALATATARMEQMDRALLSLNNRLEQRRA